MRAFESELFKTEEQAKKFAELVGGQVGYMDYLRSYMVEYIPWNVIKRYVLEDFREGIGSEEIFADQNEAISSAKQKWIKLSQAEQLSYFDNPDGIFGVYEIEIRREQLAEYLTGVPTFELKEFKTNYLWAAAKTQFIENAKATFLVLASRQEEFSSKEDLLLLRLSDHQAVIANGWDEKTHSWDFGHYYGNTIYGLSKAISDFASSQDKALSMLDEIVKNNAENIGDVLDIPDKELEQLEL